MTASRPSGIGKSRLVREAARAAEALGLVVLTGRAVASDVPTPFRPFAEALRHGPVLLFCFGSPRREQAARRALAATSEAAVLRIATAAIDPSRPPADSGSVAGRR